MALQIPVSRGLFALVDEDDFSILMQWKWHLTAGGYAGRKTRLVRDPVTKKDLRKTVFMHNVLLPSKEGFMVDHIDRNKLNNTRANLRLCTPQENMFNTSKRARECYSRFKGVTIDKRREKWLAQIRAKGQQNFLGYYENEFDAAMAYNRAATMYFGRFAALNILP